MKSVNEMTLDEMRAELLERRGVTPRTQDPEPEAVTLESIKPGMSADEKAAAWGAIREAALNL